MKRWCFIAALLFVLCTPAVSAQTAPDDLYDRQLEAAGAEELPARLPADVQELLAEWEFDPLRPESYTELSFTSVISMAWDLLRRQSEGPLSALGMLLGVVLISALFTAWEGPGDSLRQTYRGVAVLGAGGALLVPLFGLLSTVRETVEQVTVFITSFVPLYGAVLAAGGRGVGALSYQTTLLGASQLLVWLIRAGVFPLLTVSLAFGCTGSVAEGFCLDRFSQLIHKAVLWALGLFSTLFSGFLSLQQMVAAAGDTVGGRMIKFSLTSFVPVVGGLLSEAYATVAGCAGLLRSTVGGFGLLATVLIVAPPLLSCVGWSIGLQAAGSAAALFGLAPIEGLCRTAVGAVKVLIALLAVFALLMILSSTVVVTTAGR